MIKTKTPEDLYQHKLKAVSGNSDYANVFLPVNCYGPNQGTSEGTLYNCHNAEPS